jgi:hypothetical protein
MTRKEDLFLLIRNMRWSKSKDDSCWNEADLVIQEWENEHRPKKARKNKETN